MAIRRWFVVACVCAYLISLAYAVDQSKFRKCAETAFCQRLRVPIDQDVTTVEHYARQGWYVDPTSVVLKETGAQITANLINPLYPNQPALELAATLLKNGVSRLRIKEGEAIVSKHGERWEPDSIALVADSPTLNPESNIKTDVTETHARICSTGYSQESRGNVCLELGYRPFKISLKRIDSQGQEVELMAVNDAGLFHFEQHRAKNENDAQAFPSDQAGMWEENFHSFKDTKPKGPSALSVDIAFPTTTHLYGLPEHASSFALNTTRGGEGAYHDPFRLYNLDVFEYDLNVPMALYGSVPLLYAHAASEAQSTTSGVFFLNAAEMFVDLMRYQSGSTSGMRSHFMVESGIVDLFLFAGPTPRLVNAQYMSITGLPVLPPKFSVGYHQCRWNYKSQADVLDVDKQFDAHDIPYDTLWLDIEHTDGKKYFTWDTVNFPEPVVMQTALAEKGRHMVTIIDPHIKRDNTYIVHQAALKDDLYVKNKDNQVYEGWCWPGASSYIDFFLERARSFWRSMFSFDNYPHTTPFLHTWNDMNEPSVFNGPEVSMPKDCLHMEGKVEHREVHNAVGLAYHEASARGLQDRQTSVPVGITSQEWQKSSSGDAAVNAASVEASVLEAEKAGKTAGLAQSPGPARVAHRPFVLSRSFFAGTQRTGAVWTGDNRAAWSHLQIATPMLLTLGMTGIQFSGADVGGFFGNPGPELMERWFQAAAFTPFYRAHAHIDAKRREPYLFGEPHTSRMRAAIRQRYMNFPYFYTQFALANMTGAPPLRPALFEFPNDVTAASDESVFMFGDAILVRPITAEGQFSASVFLPGQAQGQVWYDLPSGVRYQTSATDPYVTMVAPPEQTPVLVRGGTGLLQQRRARRSVWSMVQDPYTVLLALGTSSLSAAREGQILAKTSFYHDDGLSFNFKRGHYLYREFKAESTATSTIVVTSRVAKLPTIDQELDQHFSSSEDDTIYAASVSAEGRVEVGISQSSMKKKLADVVDALTTSKQEFENFIERIIVYGMDKTVRSVTLRTKDMTTPIKIRYLQTGPSRSVLTLRVPQRQAFVAEDFDVTIQYDA